MKQKQLGILILIIHLILIPWPDSHAAPADNYLVVNTNDTGDGSLRWAINQANAAGGGNILFAIPGDEIHTIRPVSPLPALSGGDITIDGYSQTGAVVGTGTAPAVLKIEIDGSSVPSGNGFEVTSAGNTIQGLTINRFGLSGIAIHESTATGNIITGNHIGTNVNGTSDLGNGRGIFIYLGAYNNTIGPDNLISGNSVDGIGIIGSDTISNTVTGNYIGTDADGLTAVANPKGINIYFGAHSNTIGPNNVISGNDAEGIRIADSDTMNNYVVGNYIGAGMNGMSRLGNGTAGVHITGPQNTIGPDNVVSGNNEAGVVIDGSDAISNTVAGNMIGIAVDGLDALSNEGGGVLIGHGAQGNTVGPDNIVSGNQESGIAILMAAAGNTIFGNYVGIDESGIASLGNQWCGVQITTGALDNTVGPDNVISGNHLSGVCLDNVTGNDILDNYIGTNKDGNSALGNWEDGVYLTNGAQNNTIGPDNVISGNNRLGILIFFPGTSSNAVSGNLIGTDKNSTSALGNSSNGIAILNSAQNNTIGPDNVISGNGGSGVVIEGDGSNSNIVLGNFIGTDASSAADLGNGYAGVYITGDAENNIVGAGNVVAHNLFDGVLVDGGTCAGNIIKQSNIFGNGGLGIDLENGANNGIIAPIISATKLGPLQIVGTACPNCTVEVFENSDTDGQGERYVGSSTADGSGVFTITVSALEQPYLTATATDAISGTSEFSAVFESTIKSVYLPLVIRNDP